MQIPAKESNNGDKRGNGVEAGIMDMLDRMQTGRWKVADNLSQWLEEFRMYHRKDGKVIKERDDLICASRYALMMLRHACPQAYAPPPRDKYSRHGFRTLAANAGFTHSRCWTDRKGLFALHGLT